VLKCLICTAQETIKGSLPDGYVAIKEADARQYARNMKAYHKLLQDYKYLQDMYKSLGIQYQELITEMEVLNQPVFDDQKKALEAELIQLKKTAEVNRITIDNLKKALYTCRNEVYKFKKRKARKLDKIIELNGTNSSLDTRH
jgi:hypothetical protein